MLSVADRYIKRHDARYPVGRARLEAISVLGCASIMVLASVEVVQFSSVDIYAGVRGKLPPLHSGPSMFVALALGIAAKSVLWVMCRAAAAKQQSDMLSALAEDHLNDVWSKCVRQQERVACTPLCTRADSRSTLCAFLPVCLFAALPPCSPAR
jgi:divalent metal cation (Fe/Co/Zn/Cd) transporter